MSTRTQAATRELAESLAALPPVRLTPSAPVEIIPAHIPAGYTWRHISHCGYLPHWLMLGRKGDGRIYGIREGSKAAPELDAIASDLWRIAKRLATINPTVAPHHAAPVAELRERLASLTADLEEISYYENARP